MTAKEPRGHGASRYNHGPDEHGQPGNGCRCDVCTRANTRYKARRELMILTGRWTPTVPADRARKHLLMLREHDISYLRIAALSGVNVTTLRNIISDRPVSERIRPHIEAAIIAVEPAEENIAGGTLIDAAGTRRRLQALISAGWSIPRLAASLGVHRPSVDHYLTAGRVAAAAARAVTVLCDELWNTPPPAATYRERAAATRARNTAQARGWVPLLAWDDDEIDDPAATPVEGWRRAWRLSAAERLEEAAELAGFGLTDQHAAARLGMSTDSLQTSRRRAQASPPRRARTTAA